MKVGVIRERATHETRVALVPETVRKLREHGWDVVVESGAGTAAHFSDDAYASAGAELAADTVELLSSTDLLLVVRAPTEEQVAQLRPGATVIGLLDPMRSPNLLYQFAQQQVTAIAMELVPRITRAQSMDVLSSQATVAGYRAVLLAAEAAGRMFPMLMTAAGTIAPARVLVLGAGVAGLQAIATARRLGAVVQGYDIRPAVKEQVESLGATYVGVQLADIETSGGYAREVTAEEQNKQREQLAALVRDADVVISTAQVPGRKAPLLVTEDMVSKMKPGAVVVDLAAESGGNCEVTRVGQTIDVNGVRVLGPANLPAGVPTHASQMYSRNLGALLAHLKAEQGIQVDLTDEITGVCCVTHAGNVRVVDGRTPIPDTAPVVIAV